MLSRLPRALPALPLILDSLGRPSAPALAAALGVSARSAWRWQAAGACPRAAHLALYFASPWGWDAVACDARATVQLFQALADARAADCAALRARVAYLERVGAWGSANGPTLAPVTAAGCRPTAA